MIHSVSGNSMSRTNVSAQPHDVLPLPHPPQKPLYLAFSLCASCCFGMGLYLISTLRVTPLCEVFLEGAYCGGLIGLRLGIFSLTGLGAPANLQRLSAGIVVLRQDTHPAESGHVILRIRRHMPARDDVSGRSVHRRQHHSLKC